MRAGWLAGAEGMEEGGHNDARIDGWWQQDQMPAAGCRRGGDGGIA